MTCLPPARVKSPVWLATISRFGLSAMTFAKPSARSIAGAAPVVPSSWMISTGSVASAYSSSTHWPAFSPSLMKSEPRKDS